jgi:hypothetical protein
MKTMIKKLIIFIENCEPQHLKKKPIIIDTLLLLEIICFLLIITELVCVYFYFL